MRGFNPDMKEVMHHDAGLHPGNVKRGRRSTRRPRRDLHMQRKLQVFVHYFGPGYKCNRCSVTDLRLLCLHHVDGSGSQQRRDIFGCPYQGGSKFYAWLIKQGFPVIKFESLCANCHTMERYT